MHAAALNSNLPAMPMAIFTRSLSKKDRNTMRDDLTELRNALIDRWSDLATALLGASNPKIKCKGELRWGKHGSFSVKGGCWRDHEAGVSGDLFALIRRVRGGTFPDAVKYAREFCGVPAAKAARPEAKVDDAARTRTALQIFDKAGSLNHPIARRYLERRGLVLPEGVDGAVLRFASSCPFGPGEHHPAIVALYRGILDDEPRAISRIALTPDGAKIDRRMLGPIGGTACKLTADEDVTLGLHICEGVETGLAAMALGFVPLWALGSAGAVANFPTFEGDRDLGFELTLTIISDNDRPNPRTGKRPGQWAARTCAERWITAGQEVRIVTPTMIGDDANDILKRRQANG
jgi:hypothetical protein